MSGSKKYVMTYEGIKKLEDELEYLKTVKRKEITEKIDSLMSNERYKLERKYKKRFFYKSACTI